MYSIVHLTSMAPSKLGADLEAAGYQVFEAIEISEVMYLCEHKQIDVVVIGADFEDQGMIEVQLRRLTIKLKPGSTAKDALWELSNLFPGAQLRVQ